MWVNKIFEPKSNWIGTHIDLCSSEMSSSTVDQMAQWPVDTYQNWLCASIQCDFCNLYNWFSLYICTKFQMNEPIFLLLLLRWCDQCTGEKTTHPFVLQSVNLLACLHINLICSFFILLDFAPYQNDLQINSIGVDLLLHIHINAVKKICCKNSIFFSFFKQQAEPSKVVCTFCCCI